jgi:hypothetical protein
MCFAILAICWMSDQTVGIVATFIFLILLGDIRRIVDMMAPATSGLDLLLVVGPLIAVMKAVPLFFRMKLLDPISKAILVLMAMMFLEMFNPRQGSLLVGITGGMFFIVPILWFWIGRAFATERMAFVVIYRTFLPLGLLAGLLGVAQAYIGFLPWEENWALRLGGIALINGRIRPFGFSTSVVEFAFTVLLASVAIIAGTFSGRKAYILLLPILIAATVMAGSRGAIVHLLFAGAMIWAVRGRGARNWLPRFIFALVIGAGLIFFSAKTATESGDTGPSIKMNTGQVGAAHVAAGLSNPLEAKSSTAGLHWQIFVLGIVKGFRYPIGTGIGAITLGAGKFLPGGATTGSSEVDISDVFITMGFFGGFLYLAIIVMIFRFAIVYARHGPPIISFAFVGILSAMFGSWFALGNYSIGPLVWFCIGALVRRESILRAAPSYGAASVRSSPQRKLGGRSPAGSN